MKKTKEKIILELKKFCDKNGFKDVVFGLSGGLDSALVLALSVQALGAQHVHGIMMKTKYTSQKSLNLAKEIALLNKVDYQEIDIQELVDNFSSILPFELKNEVTEQNIQARIRTVIGMAYANEKGWMLLSCGNKSEAAMGYCTLYGADMAGSLAPIGDLYKTDIYKLADLINHEKEVIIPQEIINRPPSAELKTNQKDTDSLPEYDVLDHILKDHIFDNQPVLKEEEKLVSEIKSRYKKNAFKREQMPPVIKIYE